MTGVRNGVAAVVTSLALLCASVALSALAFSVALGHNSAWLDQLAASPTTNLLSGFLGQSSGSTSLLSSVERDLASLVGGAGTQAATSALSQAGVPPAEAASSAAALQQALSKAAANNPSAVDGAKGTASNALSSTLSSHGVSAPSAPSPHRAPVPPTGRISADVHALPSVVHRIGTMAVAFAALLLALAAFVAAERHRVLRRVARFAFVSGALGLIGISLVPRLIHDLAPKGTLGQLGSGVTAGSSSMAPEFVALIVLGAGGLFLSLALSRERQRQRDVRLVEEARRDAVTAPTTGAAPSVIPDLGVPLVPPPGTPEHQHVSLHA